MPPFSQARPNPINTTLGVSPFPPADRDYGKKYEEIPFFGSVSTTFICTSTGSNVLEV